AGSWLLHELTAPLQAGAHPLDFLLFCSSGAAVWGSRGLAHYGAANSFLDALAHYRRARGLPALSVNWGWWAGGGMASEEQARLFREIGLAAMPPERALASLGTLLATDTAQKTVAAIEWHRFKPYYEARRARPLVADIALDQLAAPAAPAEAEPSTLLRRLRKAAPSERRELLLAHVRDEVAGVLGFAPPEQLDVRLGFFQMGMDSITTIQLRNRLQTDLGCKLPSTLAFEYPTVESLATYLADELHLASATGATSDASSSHNATSAHANGHDTVDLEVVSEDELLALFDDQMAAIKALEKGF
ncbi:MAG TPA: beta-ketoacyl reductase, partial [Chloroflexota bacterium]|nr:beta-ketoacyl reductase [Chloroflexota bacterium]